MLLLGGLAWGCQKSDRFKNPNPSGNFNGQMVKEWYYTEFKGSAAWNASPQKGKKLPDWSHPRQFRIGANEVVEFPLTEERSAYPVPEASPADAARIAEASLSRIAFIKDPAGHIEVRESRLVPELNYLRQQQYDISSQYPAEGSGNFTGRIYVTRWDGSAVSAASLVNGQVTAWGKKTSAPARRTEEEGCTYYEYCVYEQQCVMQFYGDGMIVLECGPWYNTGDCWMEEVCNGPGDPCMMYGIGCGGDGPPETCTQQTANDELTALLNAGTAISNKLSIQTISSTDITRTKKYKWAFYRIMSALTTVTFSSIETGVQEYGADGFWRWISFTHTGEEQTGSSVLWTAELHSIQATPYITNVELGGPIHTPVSVAGMELDYVIKMTYQCAGIIVEGFKNDISGNSWYTYE